MANNKTDFEEHQTSADDVYEKKREDHDKAKVNPSYQVFSFDLQQCLPCLYVKHAMFYSDTCPGQNRNTYVAVMFSCALHRNTNLQYINPKLMVPGHTHLECDYDHSATGKQKKKRTSVEIVHHREIGEIQYNLEKFNTKLNEAESFHPLNLKIRGHPKTAITLDKLYNGPCKITKEKKRTLLICFISSI
ncbi:hypothetical protein PR048_011335 [Dryococelus australis]|uniref:Uncharacterized protein n=1 Tax=Dryococelus australis TaxID=614101 RepID=A0ABQ9HLA9_9NEOP|nr:hypothetical protein PR048_011335 [Dryococelus australis]